MENVFPRKGRGLRDAPMPILGDLSIPAVVLEVGFATNTDDRKKILNEKRNRPLHRLWRRASETTLTTSGGYTFLKLRIGRIHYFENQRPKVG